MPDIRTVFAYVRLSKSKMVIFDRALKFIIPALIAWWLADLHFKEDERRNLETSKTIDRLEKRIMYLEEGWIEKYNNDNDRDKLYIRKTDSLIDKTNELTEQLLK